MQEKRRPGDQYAALIKPFGDKVSIYDGAKAFLREFARVPREVGHLIAAHWWQSEVCNGGFHQFFTNSTGVLAPEALTGFRVLGLHEGAALLDDAMDFFGHPYPRDQHVRQERLDSVPGTARREWDPFYELDNRFYAWLHAEKDRWERAADCYSNTVMSRGPGECDSD